MLYNEKNKRGFTLVELAIVMTIIGLLIGGVLKGQELMENARVTATIAQVQSYEASVTAFRDKYSALPGDMRGAHTRIPDCTDACDIGNTANAGNSIIGLAGELGLAQANMTNNTHKETVLFWTQLGLTDLISGVTDSAITVSDPANAQMTWGETHPAAKIGGGFHIKHADGSAILETEFPTADDSSGTRVTIYPSGLHLVLQNSAANDLNSRRGEQALSPNKAAQIDRKMDDGEPARGFVRAYGSGVALLPGQPGCFLTGLNLIGPGTPDAYNEQSTQKECGMLFRIQG